MRAIALSIEGAWEFRPIVHPDDRGVFLEAYTAVAIQSATGRSFETAQINMSQSHQDVVRGIHGSKPPGQAKYVMCVSGAILDVVIDLRPHSTTFGQWDSICLTSDDRNAVFLSEGLGHAFRVLSPSATVVYATNTRYEPHLEIAVNPLDEDLSLPWMGARGLMLSDRDSAAQSFGSYARTVTEGII